jgi:UDPglucose--hexose-1-phosphate uridylyltransferase
MSELRQDPSTRDWVVIAPERGLRPHTVAEPQAAPDGQTETACPFCPGHEAETPPEVWRMPPDRTKPWQVRVVPNRFPMLAPDGNARRQVSPDGFVRMPGVGRHEVIVESPDHSADLARVDDASVLAVLETYRARYRALRAEGAGVILIFRNHGPRAGTSISHPHSQIVSAPIVPVQVRHRFDVAMQHYDDLGTCLYVDLLERELSDGRRVVLETPAFVAFQPFAAGAAFETWIMPRIAQPAFGDARDSALADLATVFRRVLAGLADALGDPDYNAIIHSAPPGDESREYFVWHVRVIPRLATSAGFELGTGMAINPTLPEKTADLLRHVIQKTTPAGGVAGDHTS